MICSHPDIARTVSEPKMPPAGARAERRACSAFHAMDYGEGMAPARGFSASKSSCSSGSSAKDLGKILGACRRTDPRRPP
ncbi:hypothetical protein PAHAL_1G040900 [Panicum hallii]|uniref:Uncharacterized protein n=1 Tax=Panicum hallii TaxID=206008 RepID=A0A2S3GLS5_9POAL|nr:hypothetical protein PAHAL_1G040900 [Panicum hallii]